MNNHIHWYPGHIAKAEKQLKEKLKQIDIVLEVIDARIPFSSMYKNSNQLFKDKLRIIILNKSDLSDPAFNLVWKKRIENETKCPCILTNTRDRKDVKLIVEKILKTASPIFEKLKSKGLLPRPVRVVVSGMPNVGKSSFINKLTGTSKTKTGAKAGVTRCQQWVRVHDKVELLDTPGIIPAIQDNQECALKLAMVNSVSENAYDNEYVADNLLKILDKTYKEQTKAYYNADKLTIEEIALKRNWIVKGKEPDIVRTAQFILTNFRDGKIGKITLDEP